MRKLIAKNCQCYVAATLVFIIACLPGPIAYTQTIEYSKQNVKAPYADFFQLVSNISGKHHVLCFAKSKKVTLFVYDNALLLQSKSLLELPWQELEDINIIPFSKFYFIYLHQPGSNSHQLWKISADGILTGLTSQFMALIDTVLQNKTATLQLINRNDSLVIIANTYFPRLHQIGTSITRADENLQMISSKLIFYPFQGNDRLKQVTLVGNDLLILKTSRDSVGHLLQIIKVNGKSGEIAINAFNSGSNTFLNPTCSYNPLDSTFLLYSMIERTLFMTKLSFALDEKVPVTLLKSQFKNNVAYNFLYLQNPSKWLPLQVFSRFMHFDSPRTTFYQGRNPGYNYNATGVFAGDRLFNGRSYNSLNPAVYQGITNYPYPAYPTYPDRSGTGISVRFSTVDTGFTLLADSVAVNNKSSNTIQPTEAATVILHKKSALFMAQQFGSNRQGLLKVDSDNGILAATDIRVYDRFQYLVQQLQAVDGRYVLVPYTFKKELGLVKITFQ